MENLYTVGEADMKSILFPDDIYERAAELAERDHVSVDRVVAALVQQHVGDWSRCRNVLRGFRGEAQAGFG
jgi:hypothetical protein